MHYEVYSKDMLSSTTRAFGSPLRYVQGQGEFGRLPLYTAPYGNACVIIDGFLYQDLNARLEKAYAESDAKFVSISFNGECCEEEVERIGKIARENGAAVIVGAGGGKTMDTAKICADEMGLPVIIAPSSASTDAPVSEIAVVYKPDGEYIGSRKMKKNADLVLVDTEIIVKAPRRLFVAGMGDALATWLEAQACECSDSPNYIGSGMRRCKAGMAIAKASWDILFEDGEKALMALDSGVVTEAFENVVEANTLLSGLGFLNTGLATAHGIHSGLTVLPETHKYLHGEKVAFGIVCQMVLENTPAETVDKVMRFMVAIGLPVTLADLGVAAEHDKVLAIAEKTANGPLIHQEPFAVTTERVYGAIIAADALGRKYKGL
ncbi:glycerol dehydrogenase [uncultured Cloacibacillus sp.]|uniref:glycerol dehydrogenase n=1 Tax=uncultured Cloacibacillus sp. TaxID=889794 RepID=UPI0026DBAC7A|nr:glycerol dehydrogenase [uncultured Cloacibacillus sp.]